MTYDVVTIGGMTYDLIVTKCDSKIISIKEPQTCQDFMAFDYGSKIYVEDISFFPGGGAHNTAVSFAKLGLKVGLVSCLGDDQEADRLLENIKKQGIDTQLLIQLEQERTGMSIILSSFEHDRTVLSYRGVNDRLQREMINWQALSQTKWLYLPSLSGKSHILLDDLIDLIKKKRLNMAWNPGSSQLKIGFEGLKKYFQYCDILVLNKQEVEELTGVQALNKTISEDLEVIPFMHKEPWISDVRPHMEMIHEAGVQKVIVTDGLKGAQAFDGQEYYWMPVYPYHPTDSLGAGDAFASTFVASSIQGKTLPEALILAAAQGSRVVQAYGAQTNLGDLAALEELIDKHSNYQPISFEKLL